MGRTLVERICEHCGKTYGAFRHKTARRFCSPVCASLGRQQWSRDIRICAQCTTRYIPTFAAQMVCSRLCGHGYRSRHGKKITRACQRCGAAFAYYLSQQKRGQHRGRFCSQACSAAASVGSRRHTGKRTIGPEGYILVNMPDDYPVVQERIIRAKAKGSDAINRRVREHRVVMEQSIGRFLHPWETVHHKNGEKADNRIENLEIMVQNHPSGARLTDLVAWVVKYYPEEIKAAQAAQEGAYHV